MVERERMESMTRASLNGYAVTARIEYGHGRSPLPYRRLHGLVRFAKLLRPCPHYSNLEFDAGLEWAEPNTALTRFRKYRALPRLIHTNIYGLRRMVRWCGLRV